MSEDKPQYTNIEVPRNRAEKAVQLLKDNGIWDDQGGKGGEKLTDVKWSADVDYNDKEEKVVEY